MTQPNWAEVVSAIANGFQALGIIGAFVSAFWVYRQRHESRKFQEGQLINLLEEGFLNFTGVFAKLLPGGELFSLSTVESSPLLDAEILLCLCFFEKVGLLVDCKMLSAAAANEMFRFRFFALITNSYVLRLLENSTYKGYLGSIRKLERELLKQNPTREMPFGLPSGRRL
ncbi:hypothetical protein [Paraburkholderia sp. HD33-4]|uniref:hypothetical protein n=1 Tax=Paraburkholderia sp. HD33-4 TaxID=2883242 RepID=UPI001F16F014|nr:hypothetical protein [Paraburkholderia sp. HD33-4]